MGGQERGGRWEGIGQAEGRVCEREAPHGCHVGILVGGRAIAVGHGADHSDLGGGVGGGFSTSVHNSFLGMGGITLELKVLLPVSGKVSEACSNQSVCQTTREIKSI